MGKRQRILQLGTVVRDRPATYIAGSVSRLQLPGARRSVLMTREASGAQFEIKVDGLVRTHRDFRETAIEAAHFLKQRNPAAKILITDLRDGSSVPFDHPSER
jgi:hypothetical protein